MADNEIKLIINADASGLDKATNSAVKSLTQINQASGKAQYALTNLSRVASDAPFGFIAIQNNLDPLLSSFGQLQKETGSVGGALKALGSSLAGPAGIAVGFSVVSALVTTAIQKYGSLGNAIDALLSKTNQQAETQKKINEIYLNAQSSTQSQIEEITALAKAVNNSNLPYEQRVNALTRLKKINETYFKDLKIEKGEVIGLTKAVDELTKSLIAEAVVKGFKEEIGKTAIELTKQRAALEKNLLLYDSYQKQIADVEKSQSKLNVVGASGTGITSNAFGGKLEALQNNLGNVKSEIDGQIKSVSDLQNGYNQLSTELGKAVDETLKFKVQSKDKNKEDKPEGRILILKTVKATTVALTEMGQAMRNSLIDPFATQNVLDEYTNRLAANRDVFADTKNSIANIGKELQKNAESGKELFNLEKLKQYSDLLINTLSPAFTNLFEDILSGSKNALSAFGQAIAGVIKKLIAAAVTAAIFAAIISVAFPGSAAGGASFAKNFSGIFGQLAGFKFADGGIVTGPTRALIGEAGPEAVIPLSKLDNIVGGNKNIFVTGILSGENIYLQQQRTSARRSRFV
jgi:hypothetical protein